MAISQYRESYTLCTRNKNILPSIQNINGNMAMAVSQYRVSYTWCTPIANILFTIEVLNFPTKSSISVMFFDEYSANSLHNTLVNTFFPIPCNP
ncbi:MAG: hypothetical protein EZS28_000148 [Streblomastix strix]|uniref:Uncharacterized protein n=1 Tax=Streblomastix strix TaxID=222440 RepID=A0A5J4XB28_9EUKA|nr:MAG: hypothetical protein EZS28_000148 [Streblomastix strix]